MSNHKQLRKSIQQKTQQETNLKLTKQELEGSLIFNIKWNLQRYRY